MFKKTMCAATLLACALSAQAAPQSFEFTYSSPDWSRDYHGTFSANDLNLDGVFSQTELTALTFDNYNWLGCAPGKCTILNFSYQAGGPLDMHMFRGDSWVEWAYGYDTSAREGGFFKYGHRQWMDGPIWYYQEDIEFGSDNTHLAITNTTPVPEPESWLMLGAGLGLLGAAQRKRARIRASHLDC